MQFFLVTNVGLIIFSLDGSLVCFPYSNVYMQRTEQKAVGNIMTFLQTIYHQYLYM